ncbi:hydantoinase/carbamoylase family amidase [Paracoccus sp. IB05]|uniref:hydantoinase/carbamoylase family amidase n=1 Tax=Paracoccus sp. IB05 TaxID=2779367 RepID=UPI0018E85837|nr:hydantoinase/carbamoylase family amidase [Paracoccus sp. IB05]MBJ2150210.1 hydantoinase/carbamoylase family amidase [Paracoccus sp. IB05]
MTTTLAINGERLWQGLMALAEIGGFGEGGVNRQALTDQEHEAWAWFLAEARALGLEPATDAAANLFLTLPGRDRSLAPVLIGSHMDSQPTGGRFDGIYGVLAGFEVIHSLVDAGHRPLRDVTLVAWMNEEGGRFAPGMMGSEFFTGMRDIGAIRTAQDSDAVTCGAEIDRLHRAFPDLPLRAPFTPHCYIEPHIEQGPELERGRQVIGAVAGIQGKVTMEVCLTGARGHAGTEPMAGRRDAVMAFARAALAQQAIARGAGPEIRFTIGRVEVSPNAPSVIAGELRYRIDLRHPSNDTLDRVAAQMRAAVVSEAAPCIASVEVLVHAPSNLFDPGLRGAIRASAARHGYASRDIASAAGHDARHLAGLCPSAMIFIPCHGGISHDPAESIEPAHASAGAQVLADLVIAEAG